MTSPTIGHTAVPRVLLLGEDAPGALMHSYATGFRRLGAAVSTYCLMRASRADFGSTLTRVGRKILPGALIRRVNARIVRELAVRAADLVLVIKGELLLPTTVEALRASTGALVTNYYPDDPFSSDPSMGLVAGAETLSAYDRCYTFARHLIEDFARAGVREAEWLPFARDPDMHAPVPAVEPPEFDAVFVGNLDAERVRWLEPTASRFRLGIFGEHTRAAVPRTSSVARATFLPAAYNRDLPRALARGAVALNVMRVQNRRSHNMRSFESPASGAFTLSQWTEELATMFEPAVEVVFAEDPESMADTVGRWLPLQDQRRAIARAGFARVEHDTYEARARTIMSSLLAPR
ncbi:MAG: glycosyltransferase [Gemmatimonadaceae bacterium]